MAMLAETGFADWVQQFGGLDAEIREGGKNLSFGERQLISLLRLALTRPKARRKCLFSIRLPFADHPN
jgi:ABC-type multidrug transport system fused ATPase/permease subunit